MKMSPKDIKTLTAECLAFEQQIRELKMGGEGPDVKEMIWWSAEVADSIETNASRHAKGLPEVAKQIQEGLDEILTTVSVATNGEDPFENGGDEE